MNNDKMKFIADLLLDIAPKTDGDRRADIEEVLLPAMLKEMVDETHVDGPDSIRVFIHYTMEKQVAPVYFSFADEAAFEKAVDAFLAHPEMRRIRMPVYELGLLLRHHCFAMRRATHFAFVPNGNEEGVALKART